MKKLLTVAWFILASFHLSFGAAISGTQVNDTIVPTDTTDEYPTHDDQYGRSHWLLVANAAERTSLVEPAGISELRRTLGMIVFQLDTGNVWRLTGFPNTWTDLGVFNATAATANIYTQDGTLLANRVITGDGKTLTFSGLSDWSIVGTGTSAVQGLNLYLNGTSSVNINQSGNHFLFPFIAPALASDDTLLLQNPSTKAVKRSAVTLAQTLAQTNLFNTTGTLTGARSLLGGGYDFTIQNVNTLTQSAATLTQGAGAITVASTGNATVSAVTNLSLSGTEVRLNNAGSKYIFKNTPTTAASTDEILGIDVATGEVRHAASATIANIAAASTFYNSSGSLSGNRTVTGGGYNLSFSGIGNAVRASTTVSEAATTTASYSAADLTLTGVNSISFNTPNVEVSAAEIGQYLRLGNTSGSVEFAAVFYTGSAVQTGAAYAVANTDLVPDYDSASQHAAGTIAYVTVDADSVGADTLQLGPSTPALGIVHQDGSAIAAGELKATYPYLFVKFSTGGSAKWVLQGSTSSTTFTPLANRTAVVATVADLVAIDPIRFQFVTTKGYYAAGDGGDGSYYWINNQTSTNRGSKIASSSSGSWGLIATPSGVSVRAFGAKGDVGIAWLRNTGTPITPTDDQVSIQDAVNWCGANGVPMLVPNGRYYIGSTITNRSATGVVIKGVTQNQSLAAQNGVVNTPQSMFVRSGNYTMLQFAGALTATEMTNGYYTQSWQKYVQVNDMLFEDTYTATSTTAPLIVMKRSVLSRWNHVTFIGVNSIVHDLWTADDSIFTDCRWMSCGYAGYPAVNLHRNETDGSEYIYSTINTLTFTDCVFEYNYNAAIYTSRSGIGDNGNINFNGTQFKQHRPINPVPIVDMYRTDGLNFHDTILSFGTDNIVTNKTLSSFVHLESCRADGKLNISQLTHNVLCVVTNAVRIIDPRGGRLEIDVSSGLTGAIAGDVLVRVDTTTDSYYNFSLNGRSSINSDLSDLGAFGGKPLSNHPTGEFTKNSEHGKRALSGAAFNGAFYYTSVLTNRVISTNDFTIVTEAEVPGAANDYGIWLLGDSAAGPPVASNSSVSLYWDNGLLKLRYVNGAGSATVLSSSEQILQKLYAKRTVPITVIRRSGSFELWFDNAKLQLTGTQPATTDAISSTVKLHVGVASDGTVLYSRQRVASAAIYNYALAYVDLLSYRNFGISENDKWVVATANPLSATFDTTAESFSIEDGGSLTANGTGQITLTLPASGASKGVRTSGVNGVKNKRHRISVNAWNTSGTPTALTAGLRNSSSTDTTTNSSFAFTPTGTSTWYTGVVGPEVQNNAAFRIGVTSGNSSVYLIDGIVVEQLGCIGAWQFDESGITANDLVGVADMLSPGSNVAVSSLWAAPRMTTTLRTAIPNVSAGVVVFDTTENKLYVYSGSTWEAITSAP